MLFYNEEKQVVEAKVRMAVSEDTEEIIRLVVECYGNVCSDRTMYDAAMLSTMIREGKMRIELAEAIDGRILGIETCCVRDEFPETLYLKSKMTHPSYRQYGIGREITRRFMEDINFSGFDSAFAYALTYNDISQTLLYRYQFAVTGMIYNSFLKSEDIPDCEVNLPKRSHAVMVKNIGVKEVGSLYLPEHLHEMAEQIYCSLQLSVHLKAEANGLSGQTVCLVKDLPEHQNTEILIDRAGEDLEQRIDNVLSEFSNRPLQTYNVFLNMRDLSAVTALQLLQAKGFICSGFQPLSHGREFLILYTSPRVDVFPAYYQIHPAYTQVKEFFSRLLVNN